MRIKIAPVIEPHKEPFKFRHIGFEAKLLKNSICVFCKKPLKFGSNIISDRNGIWCPECFHACFNHED